MMRVFPSEIAKVHNYYLATQENLHSFLICGNHNLLKPELNYNLVNRRPSVHIRTKNY